MDHSYSPYPGEAIARTPAAFEIQPTTMSMKESRGNQTTWIVLAILLAMVIVAGSAVLAIYKFGGATLASLSGRARNGLFEKGDPAIKSNLNGTLAGLKIVGVQPNSCAARVGLKYGDILVAYDNRPVTNEEEISAAMEHAQRIQSRHGDTI